MSGNILEMRKISKSFPGVKALDAVDFSCTAGAVHALVGENGAGKSTLMKILAGAYRPDQGQIFVDGQEVALSSPKEAQKFGISIIYQEFNLIPELNVAENIFLGREPLKRKGFIDRLLLYQRAEELLAELGAKIDLYTKAKNLSVAQQQMVEVAKALSLNADIIIMDEPSAVVSGKELSSLFRIIRSLRDSEKSIIYISHRIDEIFEIADSATVLKDGKVVGTVRTNEADKATIIRMMVGRSLAETFPRKELGERKEILKLQNVSRDDTLRNISLVVYSGEIMGIAGLVGSGRTGMARAIFGADRIDEGEIIFNGVKIKKATPKEAISRGIGFVTEDRKTEGLVQCLTVKNNLTFPILNKIRQWFFINDQAERDISERCIQEFNIATPSMHQEVQYLSGGNQQKVILAKWTNANPQLIIMDEPTRGIDVGAKTEVYSLMRMLAKQGTAIIMISSELPEILGMSDRIVVMHDGQIMGELSPDEATEEHILMMATGQINANHGEGKAIES
jgi:ribose transport system ATP-binding protein